MHVLGTNRSRFILFSPQNHVTKFSQDTCSRIWNLERKKEALIEHLAPGPGETFNECNEKNVCTCRKNVGAILMQKLNFFFFFQLFNKSQNLERNSNKRLGVHVQGKRKLFYQRRVFNVVEESFLALFTCFVSRRTLGLVTWILSGGITRKKVEGEGEAEKGGGIKRRNTKKDREEK